MKKKLTTVDFRGTAEQEAKLLEVIAKYDGVQGKLYTVRTEGGDVILPGVGDFIKEIDTERGVFVRVIPGFFTE